MCKLALQHLIHSLNISESLNHPTYFIWLTNPSSSGTCMLYINDNSHDVTSSGTCILYINENSHDVTSSGTCILYI